MLVPTKIQLDKAHYEFIKLACRDLHYRSLSDYVRQAVENKMKEDRQRLRAKKRQKGKRQTNPSGAGLREGV